jgi:hypothetical protein
MKKAFVFLFSILLAGTTLWAQDEADAPKKGFQREKLFAGGYFGLSFGDYTAINITPTLGYRFSKYFAAGMGLNGQYVSLKERDYNTNDLYYKQEQVVIGLNAFGRVYPFSHLMLQVQPEANYLFGKQIYYGPPKEEYKLDAVIAPSLLVGAGAVLPTGRSEMIISIFYDVLGDKNSPYGNQPIYNFGYTFGF